MSKWLIPFAMIGILVTVLTIVIILTLMIQSWRNRITAQNRRMRLALDEIARVSGGTEAARIANVAITEVSKR